MSAIWGCVDFSKKPIENDIGTNMEKAFHRFKFDGFSTINEANVTVGCAMQNVKVWSKNDKLPFYDKENGNIFTADCVIDNRTELIEQLCAGRKDIPDGELMYLAYLKWGADMPKKIYGAYSYAIYNIDSNKLILGVDHTTSRLLYYRRVGSKVYFSSRMEGIYNVTDKKINEVYIGLFLAMKPYTILTNPVDTPFVDIKRMVCSHYNIFTENDMQTVKYHDFAAVKPLKLKSDEEYRKAFREIFEKCVGEIIDGVDGKVGIMMTGGFDSSSIGAIAAQKLAKENKSLYSYTQIPLDSFKSEIDPSVRMCNEKDAVLEICKMYPNIEPQFLQTPETNGYSNIEEIQDIYETPYKAMTNVDWVHSLHKKAGADGCKMVLIGQAGNMSISFGRIIDYNLYEKLRTFRYIKAYKIASNYCKVNGFSRKKYFSHHLKEYYGYYFKKNKRSNYLDEVFLSLDKAKKLSITADDERLKVNGSHDNLLHLEFQKMRRSMQDESGFAHVSEYDVAFSSRYGTVVRDPAKDVRILDFCSSLPVDCFVNEVPETRRLVRKYCDDIIPKSFLPENTPRGLQSSDWHERIGRIWDEYYPKVYDMLTNSKVADYLNHEIIDSYLNNYRKMPDDTSNGVAFTRLAILYGVGMFLDKHLD